MLPESVVEFQDFQAHRTQADHFSCAISIKCLICRGRRNAPFFALSSSSILRMSSIFSNYDSICL